MFVSSCSSIKRRSLLGSCSADQSELACLTPFFKASETSETREIDQWLIFSCLLEMQGCLVNTCNTLTEQ